MKTIVPVHLDASTGAITVGKTVYPITNPGAPGAGMHLLALKRQPNRNHLDAPDVIKDGTFMNAALANQFLLQNVLSSTPDALLIVNAVGSYGFNLSDVGASLEKFGAPESDGATRWRSVRLDWQRRPETGCAKRILRSERRWLSGRRHKWQLYIHPNGLYPVRHRYRRNHQDLGIRPTRWRLRRASNRTVMPPDPTPFTW